MVGKGMHMSSILVVFRRTCPSLTDNYRMPLKLVGVWVPPSSSHLLLDLCVVSICRWHRWLGAVQRSWCLSSQSTCKSPAHVPAKRLMNLLPGAAARTRRRLRHKKSTRVDWGCWEVWRDRNSVVVRVNATVGKVLKCTGDSSGEDGYPASGEPVSDSQKVIPQSLFEGLCAPRC